MALACCPVADLRAEGGEGGPRHKVRAAELHAALSTRFPMQFSLGSVLAVQVSAPRLLLLPARNKVGATLVAQLVGIPPQAVAPGEVDVVFALHYEPSDRTVRAREPEVLDLRWRGVPPETLQQLRRGLGAVMKEAAGDLVVHTLAPRDLALADTMGFEPRRMDVVDDGVVIVFGPKARR